MNVLFVSAEAAPFAKVGGMADVVGSLPGALREQGVDARVIIPGYGFIPHAKYNISHLLTYHSTTREGTAEVHIYSTVYNDVPFFFVQAWPYFGQERTTYTDWDWDVPRFIFFNQIMMGAIWALYEHLNWRPDVVHVNDWHTGLLPFLIHEATDHPIWDAVGTITSIHNIAYQGDNVGGFAWRAGIPGRHHPELEKRNLTDNMLAIAITYSDFVTTVSPRYAIEIQYPYMGYGLDDLIRTRSHDLHGILNGIDVNHWNPATDTRLAMNFDVSTFEEGRRANKAELQRLTGLPVSEDTMLIGMVSRLVWQKGLDMAVPALRRFLAGHDVQLVVLGSGEEEHEHALWLLGRDFFWKSRAFLQFNLTMAQQIYGGADLFLMPSHFEPCGMGQMIAMRYGALPLVRETGGLADTVDNYDNTDGQYGTGFVFDWEEIDAVYGTLLWALDTFKYRQHAWRKMQKRAMQRDFSWNRSAQQYLDLYRRSVERHRRQPSYED